MVPDYREALKSKNSRKVVEAISKSGGVTTFSKISKATGLRGSVLTHHLNKLEQLGILKKEVRGTYKLRFKTPLCFIYGAETPYVYLGLLGKRNSREVSETEVALSLLKKEGIKPILTYVLTSFEALNQWAEKKLPYQWILCYDEEIIDIELVKKKIRPQLEALLKDYIVILDCTSATKPATIAYYELAQEYLTPLIYIYEEKKKLLWLISKDTIRKALGLKL